jgi:hypothetical protein
MCLQAQLGCSSCHFVRTGCVCLACRCESLWRTSCDLRRRENTVVYVVGITHNVIVDVYVRSSRTSLPSQSECHENWSTTSLCLSLSSLHISSSMTHAINKSISQFFLYAKSGVPAASKRPEKSTRIGEMRHDFFVAVSVLPAATVTLSPFKQYLSFFAYPIIISTLC